MSGSNAIESLACAAMFGFFFLEALSLRHENGYDAVATGLAFLPITLAIGALSLGWAETLTATFGAKPVLVTGLAFSTVGMGWFAIAPLNGNYLATMLAPMLCIGIGFGVAFPPLMLFAMSGTPQEDAGVVSGVLNTSAEAGGTLGLAVLATISAAGGFHLAFVGSTVCLLATIAIATWVLQPSAIAATDGDVGKEPEWSAGQS